MTGIVTDLGIELGKLLYWNRDTHIALRVRADRDRLKVLGGLLACFLVGGITGALGFKLVGYAFSIPIALLLAVMALVPAIDDLQQRP
jgi:predicted PurR-regulated permease PerM